MWVYDENKDWKKFCCILGMILIFVICFIFNPFHAFKSKKIVYVGNGQFQSIFSAPSLKKYDFIVRPKRVAIVPFWFVIFSSFGGLGIFWGLFCIFFLWLLYRYYSTDDESYKLLTKMLLLLGLLCLILDFLISTKFWQAGMSFRP
jgi:hypothetical protein